jgi:hypothetical protein
MRKKKYARALVYWYDSSWGRAYYSIESLDVLKTWVQDIDYQIVCDTEPVKVLRGLLKLLKDE